MAMRMLVSTMDSASAPTDLLRRNAPGAGTGDSPIEMKGALGDPRLPCNRLSVPRADSRRNPQVIQPTSSQALGLLDGERDDHRPAVTSAMALGAGSAVTSAVSHDGVARQGQHVDARHVTHPGVTSNTVVIRSR